LPSPAALPRLTVLTPSMDRHTLPIAVQIRMAEGEHQIATLTVLTPLARDRRALDANVPASLVLPEGTPVKFAWGSSLADTSIWYGYVSSRQVQSTKAQIANPQAPVVPVVYTLTGISRPMQSARSRAYTGVSASAAARSVIADYGLAAYVQPHPRIWPALAQGSLSDFAWLTQLAEKIGYRLNADVDRITFADAGTDLTPTSITPPTFSRALQSGIWDSLIEFDPASGQSDPSGSTVAAITSYAVRPSSGTAAAVNLAPGIVGADGTTGAPTFSKIACGSAQSYADAADNAAAEAAGSRYWVYANATVDGSSTLRPGRTVVLGGDGVTAADQGRWRISCATHALTLSSLGQATATYYAYLDLGRDQYADLDVTAPTPPLDRAGAMSLVSGSWISPGTAAP